jgi:hypothetical protein
LVGLTTALVTSRAAKAQGDDFMAFVSASMTCDADGAVIDYVFEFYGFGQQYFTRDTNVVGGNTIVIARDEGGNELGADTYSLFEPEIISGDFVLSEVPTGPVTLYLYHEFNQLLLLQAETGDTLADTIVVYPCGSVGVPGCDAYMPLKGAVVGQFVSDTIGYWKPDYSAATFPVVYIEAGKTLYVLGVDKTGEFAKVMLHCSLFWVPRNTVGPNPDNVWNNTPLPTTVVE